jgi:lysyl-tRNA synthetase class 1
VDIRNARDVKLVWRVDWPMRWEYEKVDFEPAGKEHHSHGGSFDTARLVCKEAYDWDAPVSFRYDFISIKGKGGKISSSSGDVVDLGDMLKVYTPQLVRYLFAGTRPNTEFAVSFDLDVIKIYEDYDKTERIAWKMEQAKNEEAYAWERRIYELSQPQTDSDGKTLPLEKMVKPYQIPFRHFCSLIQIADGDVEKALASIASSPNGPSEEQLPPLRARAECAKYWVTHYAPDEFRFKLRAAGAPSTEGALDEANQRFDAITLSPQEKAAIKLLCEDVVSRIETFTDDKPCAEAIYKVAEKAGIEGKALFRAAYQVLIGKDQGPRLASFLRAIDKQRLLEILNS